MCESIPIIYDHKNTCWVTQVKCACEEKKKTTHIRAEQNVLCDCLVTRMCNIWTLSRSLCSLSFKSSSVFPVCFLHQGHFQKYINLLKRSIFIRQFFCFLFFFFKSFSRVEALVLKSFFSFFSNGSIFANYISVFQFSNPTRTYSQISFVFCFAFTLFVTYSFFCDYKPLYGHFLQRSICYFSLQEKYNSDYFVS